MEVLLVNGSPHKAGCTACALEEIEQTLASEDISSHTIWIGRTPVHGCQACGTCSKNPDHRCIFDDDPCNAIIEAAAHADGIIIGSPVYYSGANGALTALLDRAFYAGGALLAGKPGAAIASARRAGTTATIMRLNQYFQISGMPIVGSSYWPMVHGVASDDVRKDEEGLQTMRNLARSMAWMLHCIEAGKTSGVEHPHMEKTARTNFVR